MNRRGAGRSALPAPRGRALALVTLTALAGLCTAVALLAREVQAQSATTFSLQRDDTELIISNMALAASGARTIGNNRNCEEGQRLTIVYGPAPGHVETQVEDAVLTSSLAVIRAPVEAEAGSEEESLELTDQQVTFSRPGCIEETEPVESPRVTLQQGRTEVVGSRFFLDSGADEGVMDGPIELTRGADEGGEPLTATADGMAFRVGEQQATLTGNVRVISEERVTTGDSLELDEEAGTAILVGQPARSVKGDDVLEGNRLLYYLDSDDVVVLGNVRGELEIELD